MMQSLQETISSLLKNYFLRFYRADLLTKFANPYIFRDIYAKKSLEKWRYVHVSLNSFLFFRKLLDLSLYV